MKFKQGFDCVLWSSLVFSNLGLGTQVLPDTAQKILRKHSRWQSMVMQSMVAGSESTDVIGHPQKWSVYHAGKKLWLVETLKSTTAGSCEAWETALGNIVPGPEAYKAFEGIFRWTRGQIDLSKSLTPDVFIQDPVLKCKAKSSPGGEIRVSALTGDRFMLSWEGNTSYTVVFYPAKSTPGFMPTPILPIRTNLWAAPLGPNAAAYELYLPGLKNSVYLKNDLRGTKQIVLDPRFPDRFISVMQAIVDEWNGQLGNAFYFINPVKQKIGTADCLSSEQMCIYWPGSQDVAWTGYAASATASYDPETGRLQGGAIFIEPSSQSSLSETPASHLHWFDEPDHSVQEIAKLFMRQREFAGYLHPAPEQMMHRTLNHEFGHANGFGHNFAGSLFAQPGQSPSATVMEYLPFPAYGKRAGNLGVFDKEMLKIVYGGQVAVPRDYLLCTDQETNELMSMMTLGRYPRKAHCQATDLGEPHEWYMELSNYGVDGVFSIVPLNIINKTILFMMGLFLVDENDSPLAESRAETVREFLCNKKSILPKIEDKLAEDHSVSLDCSAYPVK